MGLIFDIILVAILLLCIFLGYKKGLIKVGVKLVAFLVAVIVTIILYHPIANLVIKNTQIDENIESFIIDHMTQEQIENEDGNVATYVKNYAQNAVIEAQNSAAQMMAKSVSENVIGIAVMIVLFLVVRIGIVLIGAIVDAIANLPILKQFNELGGILYGTLKGLFIIYVILAIIFFISSLNGIDTITEAINNSFITRFFYDNNLILKLLFKL